MKHAITTDLNEFATAKGRIHRFRQSEEGGMTIFSLFMLVLILTLGGMAVDLMRFETTRAKLQGTLDRATLAAADLDQTLPPAEVVRDYFAKTGMTQFLQGAPYRRWRHKPPHRDCKRPSTSSDVLPRSTARFHEPVLARHVRPYGQRHIHSRRARERC